MMDMLDGDTEGSWTFLWIWKVHSASWDDDDQKGSLDAMCIEWCKARAHANRCTEEVELLKEEMQQMEQFLEWHANWWAMRAKIHADIDTSLSEGLIAYANRQSFLRHSLKTHFHSMWSSALTLADYCGPPHATLSPTQEDNIMAIDTT